MTLSSNNQKIIDVIAPSFGTPEVPLEKYSEFISSLGYKARFADNFMKSNADLFSSNTDHVRYNNLVNAILADDSDIIWAIRGGYGSTRIIPMLSKYDFSRQKKKIIIGYSDITALALFFYKKYNWHYIHGRVLAQYILDNVSSKEIECMQNILAGNQAKIMYKFTAFNNHSLEPLVLNTELIGGNLSLIQCSIGTNWQIETDGKILFIEEVGERGYRIHRTLEHLKQAGIFNNIKALILGDIQCVHEDNGESLCENAVKDFFHNANFPIIRSNAFGHNKENYPLIMGSQATLTLGKTISLNFKPIDDN